MANKTVLMRSLVGSRAHGLADEDSDWDYREVYVTPTAQLLQLGAKAPKSSWVEGAVDETGYELGHFLFLATKSNPSILEVFKGPSDDDLNNPWSQELRELFPYVWTPKGVYDSHRGYGHNQRKKFFDDPYGARAGKYACAWLRTLYNAESLIRTGDFSLSVVGTEIEETLRDWRMGSYTPSQVVDICLVHEDVLADTYHKYGYNSNQDLDRVNSFLIRVRKSHWGEVESFPYQL